MRIACALFVVIFTGSGAWGQAWAQAKWNFDGGRRKAEGASRESAQARDDYQTYCAQCHGQQGDGNSQLGRLLDPPPANHTDPERMSKASDERIFKTISEGGDAVGLSEGMPAHKTTLNEERIRGLVKYIRQLCGCEYRE
ncbi:MAG: c-type cytochrome [Candidatus Nitrospinota bacterium M3_3B_026]